MYDRISLGNTPESTRRLYNLIELHLTEFLSFFFLYDCTFKNPVLERLVILGFSKTNISFKYDSECNPQRDRSTNFSSSYKWSSYTVKILLLTNRSVESHRFLKKINFKILFCRAKTAERVLKLQHPYTKIPN